MQVNLADEIDQQSKKDYQRLKHIILTEDEWILLADLTKVLKQFHNATNLLGGSQYSTISFMYTAIMTIKQNLNIDTDGENINYTYLPDAFDDDPDLQDEQEYYDQISEEEMNQKNLKINNPQITNGALNKVKFALLKALDYYWKIPTDEALLATILDPHNKRIDKATAKDRYKAESLLISEYEYLKSDELEDNITNNNNTKNYEENELLYAMYGSNPERVVVNEVESYLALNPISSNQNALVWWEGQKDHFRFLVNWLENILKLLQPLLLVSNCFLTLEI